VIVATSIVSTVAKKLRLGGRVVVPMEVLSWSRGTVCPLQ
jgi:hypothetical protein